jgi:hypothetical protein
VVSSNDATALSNIGAQTICQAVIPSCEKNVCEKASKKLQRVDRYTKVIYLESALRLLIQKFHSFGTHPCVCWLAEEIKGTHIKQTFRIHRVGGRGRNQRKSEEAKVVDRLDRHLTPI